MASQVGKLPHFYKIILHKTIREGKFGIPMKFMEKIGNLLSSPIILEVPCGKSWKVELIKIGDEIWVEKGWQEFSKYYCLKFGHMVLFKYEGNCHFNVRIFDMSAVEIKYPCNAVLSINLNHGRAFQCPKVLANEDDISCEILEDSTSGCNQSRDLMAEKGTSRKATKPSCSNTSQPSNNFISSNSPSFKAVLRHPYILCMPFSFVQSHMKCETQTVMLQVANKSWPVKLNVYPHKNTAILSAGWISFAKENSLKVKDVCYFQLIKKNVMIVSKFKCAI